MLDVDAVPVSGTWWRHVPPGADVLYQPPDPADNRWQRGLAIDALYFADSPETAWAEWYRSLAEAGLPPQRGLPRDLWDWEISLPDVANLSDDARLARVGLPAPQPSRVQWPLFQPIGEQLFAEGWSALLAASAARPNEGQTLCVFRTDYEVAGVRALGPPETIDEPPVIPPGLRT